MPATQRYAALLVLASKVLRGLPGRRVLTGAHRCARRRRRVGRGSDRRPAGRAQGRRRRRGRRLRAAFFRAPYLRDAFVAMGICWRLRDREHREARALTPPCAPGEEEIGTGAITDASHVYHDGPHLFHRDRPTRRGEELGQWAQIKQAATAALVAAGGTITHHHAIGRDHRRWYDRQRPEPFAVALRAAKEAIDPAGLLNPGVLIDTR